MYCIIKHGELISTEVFESTWGAFQAIEQNGHCKENAVVMRLISLHEEGLIQEMQSKAKYFATLEI
jgi:hypothetical protein